MPNTTRHPGRGGTRHGVWNATSKARISHSSFSTRHLSFEDINRATLPLLPILLKRWLPKGRRVGSEYLALNPTRLDLHLGSFKIVICGPRAGMWADFATGDKGGDVISLAAYLFRLSQAEAARRIARMLGSWS
jgi:hypothetical protein